MDYIVSAYIVVCVGVRGRERYVYQLQSQSKGAFVVPNMDVLVWVWSVAKDMKNSLK